MIGAVISIFLQLSQCGPDVDTLRASQISVPKPPALAVSTLDRKSIESLPSTSVADAIRLFSGVQVKDYGGIGGLKTVNVRSLGSQHVGVFYNGIKIVNAQNGQVDLGRFSLDNVESISIYQAQKADMLQTASDMASAASVYINSRVPEKTGMKAAFRTGAFGTVNPSVLATYAGKELKASADLSYLYTNGKYRFTYHEPAYDTTATRSNGDVKALRTELMLQYRQLTVNGYYYGSERGLPGPVVRRVSDQYSSKDRQWDQSGFLQADWKTKPGRRLALRLKAKFMRDYCRYVQDPSKNAAVMPVDNRYWQSDAFLSVAGMYKISERIDAGLALDGRYNAFSSNALSKANRLSLLAAAQLSVRPLDGWHIYGSLLNTALRDKREGKASVTHKLTPTAIVSFEGLKHLKFRAFYKEIFRAPTFNDLYYTIGGRSVLKPEYTRQFDAGLDLDLPLGRNVRLKAGADAYISKVWDKICAIPAANQFRWSVINYGLAKIKGVDATMTASYRKKDLSLDLRATYTYEDARDRTDKMSPWYGGRLAYSPTHSGSLAAFASYRKLSASVCWLYTGKRYRDSANIAENMLEPWYTTDLSVTWSFMTGRAKSSIGLDVNNLLDQDYEVVSRYPMPGRHLLLKLTIEY